MRNVFFYYLLKLAALELSSGLLLAQEPQRDPLSELDWLERDVVIRAVVERNPTIESARQAWKAAREREPRLSSLDDPSVSYRVAPLSIFAGDVRYGQSIGFAQRLPYPGKLRLRGEIARAEAEAARHDYEAVRLQLATMASLLFDDYYFVARALEINAEHIYLLEDFQRIATARYVSGLAAQQDPLQAEVEVAHVLHRDVVLRTSQRTIVAQLNALLHRAPDASLPPPPSELGAPDTTVRADQAPVERPELEARLAEIGAREAEVRLREKDFYPDFEATTSFNSMWGDWEYRWMIGISINLPIRRDRLRAASAEAAAALKAGRKRAHGARGHDSGGSLRGSGETARSRARRRALSEPAPARLGGSDSRSAGRVRDRPEQFSRAHRGRAQSAKRAARLRSGSHQRSPASSRAGPRSGQNSSPVHRR